MTHLESCQKMEGAFKDCRVEELRKRRDDAWKAYEGANMAYLDAREEYHKIYREIWG